MPLITNINVVHFVSVVSHFVFVASLVTGEVPFPNGAFHLAVAVAIACTAPPQLGARNDNNLHCMQVGGRGQAHAWVHTHSAYWLKPQVIVDQSLKNHRHSGVHLPVHSLAGVPFVYLCSACRVQPHRASLVRASACQRMTRRRHSTRSLPTYCRWRHIPRIADGKPNNNCAL
jgi:hypothetical protein